MGFGENYAPAFSSFMIGNGQEQQTVNGRIDLMSSMPLLEIPQYQQKNIDNTAYAAEAVAGVFERTPVSDLFFSVENINALQEGIRYRVWVETNEQYVIGRQNDTELKIIMRALYMQYGQNKAGVDCLSQVRDINKRVLEYAVPEVITNLKQYETYRRDISTLPVPLERGQLATNRGSKTLEYPNFM